MTFEEFDKQGWCPGLKAQYRGFIYDVESANFQERLVGIDNGSGDEMWVRCENVTIINDETEVNP